MYVATIVVVDATRARLFTFEREASPTGLRESFVEVHDLVNPARRLRPSELFSDSRPGSSRTGGLRYTFDDHRDAHVARMDHEFARAVVAEIERVIKASGSTRVILCATPNMLGDLRKALGTLHERAMITTLARDLVRSSVAELRERLATYRALPLPPERSVELR